MRLYTARWLLPVSAPPVPDGAVAIDPAGRVAYAGPAAGAPPGEIIALGDAALLPGLAAALDRPRADTVARALAAGATTLAVTAPDGPALDALLAAGVRAAVYVPVRGPTPADRGPALSALQQHVAALRARIDHAGAAGRVRVGVTPSDMPLTDEDLLLDACAWAVGESLPLAVPAGRSVAEVAYLREAAGGPYADARRAAGLDVVRRAHSTVHLLAELGIAAVARPLLAGGAHFDESDVALAAYYGCPVAYAPTLDAPSPDIPTPPDPLAALADAGIDVALAAADPLGLARALGVAPEPALRLATLAAARALGLGADAGSLEPGKHADLCAFALTAEEIRAADANGPARAVLDAAGRPPVLTLVAGRAPTPSRPAQQSRPV